MKSEKEPSRVDERALLPQARASPQHGSSQCLAYKKENMVPSGVQISVHVICSCRVLAQVHCLHILRGLSHNLMLRIRKFVVH